MLWDSEREAIKFLDVLMNELANKSAVENANYQKAKWGLSDKSDARIKACKVFNQHITINHTNNQTTDTMKTKEAVSIIEKQQYNNVTENFKKRLEELRTELRNECISYGELAELQSLTEYIDKDDVELLQAAGVPEDLS